LHAPWLQELLETQAAELKRIRELLEAAALAGNAVAGQTAELVRIRELLELASAETLVAAATGGSAAGRRPEAKGRAARRETR
jgi:uncharacterized membrane protein